MPRLRPDQYSLLDQTRNRLVEQDPDWNQYDFETKATKLKEAFREDVQPAIWEHFAACEHPWWKSAVYTMELPEPKKTAR